MYPFTGSTYAESPSYTLSFTPLDVTLFEALPANVTCDKVIHVSAKNRVLISEIFVFVIIFKLKLI